MNEVPKLEGAMKLLEEDCLNRAHRTNQDYSKEWVEFSAEVGEPLRWLTCDPQTSGGLLVACAPERVDDVLALFHQDGFADARVIGELDEGPARVEVV